MRNYPEEKMEIQAGFAHNIQEYQRQKAQSEVYVNYYLRCRNSTDVSK